MLEVEYKGANSIIVSTKDATMWIDPMSNPGTFKPPKGEVLYLATEARFLPKDTEEGLILEGPGEYETGPFWIRGVGAMRHLDTLEQGKHSTMYRVDVGEFRLGVLGNIAGDINDDQEEVVGTVDILFVPVGGGGYTLDATAASKLVRDFEPKIVVPIHYNDSTINYEVPQDEVDTFIHELAAPVEDVQKLKLKSPASLPATLTVYKLG